MILYKQITYIKINEVTHKLEEKYSISRTYDKIYQFTFDRFVAHQQKRQLPHVNITMHNVIPTGIIFDENEDFYNKEDIHNLIEVGTFTSIIQAENYTFDELKAMLSAHDFIKYIINVIKKEGVL